MNLVELRQVRVGHHRQPLLPPIDLNLPPGVFLGMVGPNGSGATLCTYPAMMIQSNWEQATGNRQLAMSDADHTTEIAALASGFFSPSTNGGSA